MHINFQNVFAEYENNGIVTKAVQNFNLSVEPGDFVGILGESGCGKSTILRLASGLLSPSSGSVTLNDANVSGVDKTIGYVFQGDSLLPWLSVFDNIALGYRLKKQPIPKNRIHEVIELVGLSGFEKARPNSLSGGMAQRAAIARAIVDDPKVLLMDEPFSALDAITRKELQDELIGLVSRLGVTTLFVTHDFNEIVRLARRIVLLTPRPGSIFQTYDNDREDEVASLYLKNEISKDIYKARAKRNVVSQRQVENK